MTLKCERDAIVLALLDDGNRKRAAKALGIGERTLYRKIKEYDIRDSRRRKPYNYKKRECVFCPIRLLKSLWAGIWATFK